MQSAVMQSAVGSQQSAPDSYRDGSALVLLISQRKEVLNYHEYSSFLYKVPGRSFGLPTADCITADCRLITAY